MTRDIPRIDIKDYDSMVKALEITGLNIVYIPEHLRDEELQLIAVRDTGEAIGYIFDPSEEVQLAAVKQNGLAIYHIYDNGISSLSEEVQLAAVKQEGCAIKAMFENNDFPSEEVQLAAVENDPEAIEYICKYITPSEEVQLAAVNQNCFTILYIDDPSEEVQLASINNDIFNIDYISDPCEEVLQQLINIVKRIAYKNCYEDEIRDAIDNLKFVDGKLVYSSSSTSYSYVLDYASNQCDALFKLLLSKVTH